MDTAFDPWSPAFVADPYPAYEELRAAGRVHWFAASGRYSSRTTRTCPRCCRDRRLGRTYLHRFGHEEFGRTPPPPEHEPFHVLNGHGLLDLEGPDHTRIRRLVSKRVHAPDRGAAEADRGAAGRRTRRRVRGGWGGDLLARVAEPLPVAVIAEMLGIPAGDRHLLRPWSAAICGMFELRPDEETARRAVTASAEFSGYLRELIAARRKAPGTTWSPPSSPPTTAATGSASRRWCPPACCC